MTTAQAKEGVFSTDDDDSEAALAVGAGAMEKRFHASHRITLIYNCLAHRSVSVHRSIMFSAPSLDPGEAI